jgi:hypothetical protein
VQSWSRSISSRSDTRAERSGCRGRRGIGVAILSAEAAGLELDRRGDADPAIVLCTVLGEAA